MIYEMRYVVETRAAVVRALARRCGGRVLSARDPVVAGAVLPAWRSRVSGARVRVSAPREVHLAIMDGLRALQVEWRASRRHQGRLRHYVLGPTKQKYVVVHSSWLCADGQQKNPRSGALQSMGPDTRPPAPSAREVWETLHRPNPTSRKGKKELRAARNASKRNAATENA